MAQSLSQLQKRIRSLEEQLEQYQRNSELFRSFARTINLAVIMCDQVTGRLVEADSTACTMFGYSREELTTLTLSDLGLRPDRAAGASVEPASFPVPDDGLHVYQWHAKKKNGRSFWAEVTVMKGTGMHSGQDIILVRDITQQKQQQVELAESRMNLELVINNIPQRIFWKDLNLNYLGCNRWFALDGGLTSSREIVGLNDYQLGWHDQAEMYRKDDLLVITSGRPKLNYEEPQTTPEGETIWLRTNKIPFTNYEGEIIGVLGTYENITREKKMQQQLTMAMQAARYYLVDVNLPAQMVDISHELLTLMNLNIEHSQKNISHYLSLIHPDDLAILRNEYRRHVSEKTETLSLEFRVRKPDGTLNWLSTSGKVTEYDRKGNPVRMVGLITDINDRKEAQEAVRKINVELEKRVKERTLQLTEAVTEMEAFSYSVSHDLRAPLRHIDGFSKMLKEKAGQGLDDESSHYLDNIIRSAGRMERLIDDLLVFSRAGRTEMNRMRFDLALLFREVLNEQTTEEKDRKIRWTVEPLGDVYADPGLIRQVAENLVSNALKYTRQRKIAEIQVGKIDPGEPPSVFFIRDNGVGFNMKYYGKLFNVFQRLHSEEEFEGTGIGLASVKQIIKRHGGRIWAEGTEHAGAIFYFTVPGDEPDRHS